MATSDPAQVATLPAGAPAFPARYRPVQKIGAGSFGTVWKVTDAWTGETRAAKILLDHTDKSLNKQFFHEFALLFRLRHPGLIRTFDYGRLDDGSPFFHDLA